MTDEQASATPNKEQEGAPMCIVLVWWRHTFRATGRYGGRYGERAETESVEVPVACIWLRSGSTGDIGKAKAYAEAEGKRVFLLRVSETDPLGKAKRMLGGSQGFRLLSDEPGQNHRP